MVWRKVAVLAAAAAASVLVLAPQAVAATIVNHGIVLNNTPDQKGQTAESFKTHDCSGPFATLPDGKDGWHFVLPKTSGIDFVSVDISFTNLVPATVHVIVPEGSTSATGAGWSANLVANGSGVRHLYVITTAGWTLLDGSGTATGDSTNPYTGAFFNLSHTCPAVTPPCTENCTPPPPCDPTVDNCTPPPCDQAAVAAVADCQTHTPDPTTTPPSGGRLPTTGTPLTGVIVAGFALLAGGTALVFLRRRRSSEADPLQ